ncbi:MAG: hypothetical protein WBV06_18470, partial [Acidimicrobiia bacterium]
TTEPTPTVIAEPEFVGTGLFLGALSSAIQHAVAVVIAAAHNTGSTTIAFSTLTVVVDVGV